MFTGKSQSEVNSPVYWSLSSRRCFETIPLTALVESISRISTHVACLLLLQNMMLYVILFELENVNYRYKGNLKRSLD